MPPRRAAAAAATAAAQAEAVAQEEEQEHDEEQLVKLQFDEPLTWRAGKPISTGELLRRLDALSKELGDMEQELTDTKSLAKVARELVSPNLLTHKDKGVKAFVACCIVDILRICAPDAPFTPAQIRDLFNLFITSILPALQDPTNTYNNQHKYLLTSLVEVESICLLNTVDNGDALILHLFSVCFDTVSGPKSASGERISKDVELHLQNLLCTLIGHAQSLPPKVVDVIMAQFLRAAAPGAGARDKGEVAEGQSTLLLKTEPEAYLMAKAVCNEFPDKMARLVAHYFSDVIVDVSSMGGGGGGASAGGRRHNGAKGTADDSEEEEQHQGPSESDLRELRKAHLLLRELWRACPAVLPNVISSLDQELQIDNVQIRQLATETLGDMIAGIGAAGPPSPPTLDPAAYPPLSLASDDPGPASSSSVLTTPLSPQSFAQTHPAAYRGFVNRRIDKSPAIRAAWAVAVGYILATSAGGVGLARDEESELVKGLGDMLNDSDEKVRLAAVKAIQCFSFRDIMTKLAPDGDVTNPDSVLGSLALRCKDMKHHVREEGMAFLGKLWAVSTGELVSNPEAVAAVRAIPSCILQAFYTGDEEIRVLLEGVMFECLVPLSFPASAKKATKNSNGNSQNAASAAAAFDADAVRAHRIMLMASCMDERALKALFAFQNRQPRLALVVDNLIKACEAFNGGVSKSDQDVRQNLAKMIDYLARMFPDPSKVATDLNKFAKTNDRRSYQLVKFIISHESDFKTMHRALKELIKRHQGPTAHVMQTLLPLLYRSGMILFNKSHLSTFLEYSRSNQDGLAATAHEFLNNISQHSPKLFKAHIGTLCADLQKEAPTASKPNVPAMVETLKACGSFATKYPDEIPHDKGFLATLENYALYGQPRKAAKYAVNVLLANKDDKRSLAVATNLLRKALKGLEFSKPHFLSKLATISQLELLAPNVTEDAEPEILDLAMNKILRVVRTETPEQEGEWVKDSDLDEEGHAKLLALKLLVNQVRALPGHEGKKADTTMKMLGLLVTRDGEVAKGATTPLHHRKRLRLLAAQLMLKLCTLKDELLPHAVFDQLALVAQDATPQVRRGFIEKLQKYLSQARLKPRFHTIIFLAAGEPNKEFKHGIETSIRSRVHHFQQSKSIVMEQTLSRLLSLLAHHPDFDSDLDGLAAISRYLLFYVANVASESNLGMLFKYAERSKQTIDALRPDHSENLYVICDLALAILRKWQEKRGWAFQAYPSKIGLPMGLFSALPSHDAAQKIAETSYVPDDIDPILDDQIKALLDRRKKRKFDDRPDANKPAKKPKAAVPKAAAASSTKSTARKSSSSKAAKASSSKAKKSATRRSSSPANMADRRRSGRSRLSKSYAERDSSEDDEEMRKNDMDDESEDSDDSDDAAPEPPRRKAAPVRAMDAPPDSDGDSSSLSELEDTDVEEAKAHDGDSKMKDADDSDELSEVPDGTEDEDERDKSPPLKVAGGSNGRRATRAAAAAGPKTAKPKTAAPANRAAAAKTASSTRLASRTKPRTTAANKGRDDYDMEDEGNDDD